MHSRAQQELVALFNRYMRSPMEALTGAQVVCQMITDIRHLCDHLGFDYHKAERDSYNLYLEEKRLTPCGKQAHVVNEQKVDE